LLFNKRIVIVTPAGRRSTMQILEKYIVALYTADLIDGWLIWENTKDIYDRKYISDLFNNYEWVDIDRGDESLPEYGTADNLKNYWDGVCDENTVYVRFDDDIVFIELEKFAEFIKFRIDNPEYLVVYPTIINNTGIAYKMQQEGLISPTQPMIGEIVADNGAPEWNRGGFHPCDAKAWADTDFCRKEHLRFILNAQEKWFNVYRLNEPWELTHHETVSINSCSWIGSNDPKQFEMGTRAEEGEIVYFLPKKYHTINCVYNNFIVSHYAFYTQKATLDSVGIDKLYKDFADEYCSNFLRATKVC